MSEAKRDESTNKTIQSDIKRKVTIENTVQRETISRHVNRGTAEDDKLTSDTNTNLPPIDCMVLSPDIQLKSGVDNSAIECAQQTLDVTNP